MICNGNNCKKTATMRCPQCIALNLNPETSFFCGKSCYTACWKDHKLLHVPKCEENMSSPPFSITVNNTVVPLKAVTQRDENGCLDLLLVYSDHLGAEALRPWAAEFGAYEDPLILSKFWYDGISFGVCSTPIDDKELQKSCRSDEFSFNVLLFKDAFKAMLEAGLLEVVAGKKTRENFPIVRLKNLESWSKLSTPETVKAGLVSKAAAGDSAALPSDDDWVVC